MIACLIMKVIDIIQFTSEIGPLVKIVGKMVGDFMNFLILYALLVIMFAIVGNINFVLDLKEFHGLFESTLTVLDASIGNYDFALFGQIRRNAFLEYFGDVYIIFIVVTFNILILNLIIAILSNTYNMFDSKATGLYLSKILIARDEMTFDENYGAFLLAMTPLNVIILPFVPYGILAKPSPQMNIFMTILQYAVFIVIIYVMFLIGSILFFPFAYIKSCAIKFKIVLGGSDTKDMGIKLAIFLTFVVLGVPSLSLNLISDFFYFWANNFRSNLKKIIIEKNKSTLSHDSVREIKMQCAKYGETKIKSVYSVDMVKSFRQQFLVKENIQYLLFGQMIPEDGWGSAHQQRGDAIIKSLKTSNLKAYRNKVEELSNKAEQEKKSKADIEQYNNIKSVLMNFSFDNMGHKTLAIEIIENVMDELRRERKIEMVLADDNIEEYIKLDLEAQVDDEELSPYHKSVLEAKKVFRAELCQKVSILRLGYMYKMLKLVHPGRANMLAAEAFKAKVVKLERKDNKKSKKEQFKMGT